MISGGGRTLLNLADEIDSGRLRATIDLVIASRECRGAERARARGFETIVVPGEVGRETLDAMLESRAIDWVVLAGYLRYVHVPAKYRGRIVNIHPALLPEFGGKGMYGERVHAAVLASGAAETGCTVHLVDEEYDHGPIVLQARCPVVAGDTVKTLARRVFELECEVYPEALRRLIGSGHGRSGDAGTDR
ncbi:MAG: phosphoribosylglycinamide formyltransferase [Phycisphaerales bacterium]|nr:phosphoribosylglycinamide formyltransferase [Phycisphaerales bacterium]